jgi:hypothetical protein
VHVCVTAKFTNFTRKLFEIFKFDDDDDDDAGTKDDGILVR